jgi:hypothetical protein
VVKASGLASSSTSKQNAVLEPLVALGAPAALFLAVLGRAGFWDPYELNVADLARRAAINVYGASSLAWPSADNRLPTLGDLGRGELPIDAMALSFRVLGMGPVTGRLPLALFAIAGLVALWLWLRRTVAPRAGTYGTLVLSTMPLYFVHARTMLGDATTMASLLFAFAGLSVVVLDPRSAKQDAPWAVLGVLGLGLGFLARGGVIGVGVPALSVGLAWGLGAMHGRTDEEVRPRAPVAIALLVGGAVAVGLGVRGYLRATPQEYSPWLGAAVLLGQRWPTFDATIHHLGHVLFPWSALVPLAFGRLFAPPPSVSGPALAREEGTRLVLVVGAGLAFAAHAMLAPRIGVLPFSGVGLLAAIVALVLFDFERGAHPSRALAVASILLVMLFFLDFTRMPEKGLSAFGVANATFPEAFRVSAEKLVKATVLVFAALLFFAFLDGHEEPEPRPDEPWYIRLTAFEDVRKLVLTLNDVWQGNLTFVAVMLEAMLVGIAALLFFGDRLHLKVALRDSLNAEQKRWLLNAWWLLPPLLVVGTSAFLGARRSFRELLARFSIRRGQVGLAAGVLAGLTLSVGYYPALASQLSPKEVFEAYARTRKGTEPLALLGVAGRSAAYYTGGDAKLMGDVPMAFDWLMSSDERRFLAARSDDLAKLNSLYRAKMRNEPGVTPDHNLPVLDAHSSQIALVSNRLGPGEMNDSPFAKWLSASPPTTAHPLEANLDDVLMALGWDVYDARDEAPATLVTAGRPYVMHLYFRVTAPITVQWKSFIHIDGQGRRFNGDHEVFDGKVPMNLWNVGDVVTDRYRFELEPNFTPGTYQLYYGLFQGEKRLPVKSGRHHENRIDGGPFRVQ